MENEVKEPVPKSQHLSPDEYLAFERSVEYRNEYFNGQVLGMGGANLTHNYIIVDLVSTIANFLNEKECQVLLGKMRVVIPSRIAYMYPDVLIFCGKPELEDDEEDSLKNPSAIFEILSPGIRGIEKGRKFFIYQEIPSLKEFIMIDSLKKFVYHAQKDQNGRWEMKTIDAKKGSVFIRTIDFHLPFELIYRSTGL